jgi:hypothetical protein
MYVKKIASGLGQHGISHRSHREEHLASVTALDCSSPYTLRPRTKRTTRWLSVGKRMLMEFSYLYVPVPAIIYFFHIDWNTIDWSILCRSRCPPCCYRPGLKAEQPGHLRILPWQYLPGSRRPERNTVIHSFPYRQTTPIHSSEIRYLGEFALVLEPRYEP